MRIWILAIGWIFAARIVGFLLVIKDREAVNALTLLVQSAWKRDGRYGSLRAGETARQAVLCHR